MERETGFEPATSTLARLHSTTELLPQNLLITNHNCFLEAASRFELENGGFADLCLTTWLCRRGNIWSGRRDLNPRLQPWQGCTLPLSYSRSMKEKNNRSLFRCQYTSWVIIPWVDYPQYVAPSLLNAGLNVAP